MNHHYLLSIPLLALGLACGGTQQNASTTEESDSAAASHATRISGNDRDESSPAGPIDQTLADQGATLFQAKGCIGCHTIGEGRLTGPDLSGVTERRTHDWMIAMIANPDSMLQNDETARQLFAEYMTPMLNMNVTRDEAQAIYEYLRRESQ